MDDIFEGKSQEQIHASVMNAHNKLLLEMSGNIRDIKVYLLGNEYTENKGLIHQVALIHKDVGDLLEWKKEVQLIEQQRELDCEEEVNKNDFVIKKKNLWIAFAAAIFAAVVMAMDAIKFIIELFPKKH